MKKLYGPIWISDSEHNWEQVGVGIMSCSPTGFHRVFKRLRGRVYRLIHEYQR